MFKLWIPRKWLVLNFKIVLLNKSAKINASFLTGDFHKWFHHLLPDSKYWSPIVYKFHFKVSPVTMINAESWLLRLKDRRLSRFCFCHFPSLVSEQKFHHLLFQVEKQEVLLPAERLFPSDNSLSPLKCEQITERFTCFW